MASRLSPNARRHARQFSSFVGVGLVATAVHYGFLIALVERGGLSPIPATLIGYTAGGVVSYLLNRRLTYRSDRPHREATWRFAAVAAIGFGLTWLLMTILVRGAGLPYLPAQVVTTGIMLFWNYLANKLWTFGGSAVPPIP